MNTVLASLTLLVLSLGPASDAMDAARLERMLDAGDDTMVAAVFRRYPNETLPFIDGYLEGGLALVEEGGSETEALESFRRAIRFAEIADGITRDQIFVEYASSFASWSPEERLLFRRGQELYRAGREADDPQEALRLHEQSLEIAESLGDSWGMAMAYGGIARAHLRLEAPREAIDAANQASIMNRRLRQSRAEIAALLVAAEAEVRLGRRSGGVRLLARAWQLADGGDDATLRREVLVKYVDALEHVGQAEMADQMRARLDDEPAADAPPATAPGE